MTKAATAATDSPAICAGVILGGASASIDADTEVAVGGVEIVSATTGCVGLDRDCEAVVVTEVMVAVVLCEDIDVARGVLLATTVYVRAVLVGTTASF